MGVGEPMIAMESSPSDSAESEATSHEPCGRLPRLTPACTARLRQLHQNPQAAKQAFLLPSGPPKAVEQAGMATQRATAVFGPGPRLCLPRWTDTACAVFAGTNAAAASRYRKMWQLLVAVC